MCIFTLRRLSPYVDWPGTNDVGCLGHFPPTNHTSALPCRGSARARARCTVFTGVTAITSHHHTKHTATPLPCETPTQSRRPITLLPAADATWSLIGEQMGAKRHRSIGGICNVLNYRIPNQHNQHTPTPIYQGPPVRCELTRTVLPWGRGACMHGGWHGGRAGRQWLSECRTVPVYPSGRHLTPFLLFVRCVALR